MSDLTAVVGNSSMKHAGDYSDEDAYNCDTDKLNYRKLKIICPNCKHKCAALLSPHTKKIDSGWRWVGCDHKEPFMKMESLCRICREKYTFTVYTPQ